MPIYHHIINKTFQLITINPENITSNTGDSYQISSSSSFSNNYLPWKVFNGVAVTADGGWFCSNGGDSTPWIQIQFSTPQLINFYSFNSTWDSKNQVITEWILQASNDGNTWINLDNVTNQNLNKNNSNYSNDLKNLSYFSYYRIYFPTTNGYPYIGIQNLKLNYKIFNYSSEGIDEFGHSIEYNCASDAECSPFTHKILTYLESTGTQFIDTGLYLDRNNLDYIIEMIIISEEQGYCFGYAYQMRPELTWLSMSGNKNSATVYYGIFSNSHTDVNIEPSFLNETENIYKFDMKSGFYVNNNLVYAFQASSNIDFMQSMPILARYDFYNQTYEAFASCKIHEVKISRTNGIIMDLIPVLDKNNIPCMYDKVTKQLFYNRGSGTFNYGE